MSENIKKLGQDFHAKAIEQFDSHLLIGEEQAKLGALVTMVAGINMVMVGDPGGGKTVLATNMYRVIDGIEGRRIADIPPIIDMSPMQLVGGTVETTETVTRPGQAESETVTKSTTIEPIVKPDSQALFIDEINRLNPMALNALLGAMESKTLKTTAGTVELAAHEFGVATMNPSGRKEGTVYLNPATVSRHAVGVVMGGQTGRENRVGKILGDGWEPTPTEIVPVIDLEQLHRLREFALKGGVSVGGDVVNYAYPKIDRIVDTLHKKIGGESDSRLTRHVGRASRSLAVLRGQDHVTTTEIDDALKFVVTARVGIMGTQGAFGPDANIADAVQQVING